MMSSKKLSFSIYNRNDVLIASNELSLHIATYKFDQKATLEILTATREAMFNVVKYATKGLVSVKKVESNKVVGVEIIVDDTGVGIVDIEKVFSVGYSSSGTMGVGLSVIINSMDEVIIVPKDDGVKFIMRKYEKSIKKFCSFYHQFRDINIAMKSIPCTTYEKSGDCGIALQMSDSVFFAHWDVEGHNSDKVYQTSLVIYKYMLALHHYDIQTVLKILNSVIFSIVNLSRASIVVGRYDKNTKEINMSRVGNINYIVVKNSKQTKSLSAHGVLGAQSISPQSVALLSEAYDDIIFYSDGVSSLKLLNVCQKNHCSQTYEAVDVMLKSSSIERDDSSIMILNRVV
jgi:serine/threonine-protein kinase RsbT